MSRELLKPDHARNMRLIGYSDQGGRPNRVQVMVANGHALIGHMIGTTSVAAVESQVWLGRAMQALQQASVLTGPAVDGDQAPPYVGVPASCGRRRWWFRRPWGRRLRRP